MEDLAWGDKPIGWERNMEQHATTVECKAAALEQFEEATEEDSWMMAIWTVKDDIVTIRRTTCKFPNKQYRTCQESLQKAFRKELIPAVNTNPLPIAPRLRLSVEAEENGENNKSV